MTSLSDLQQLISGGESETLEFKQSTGQRSEAAKTLCAMANHRGGRVIFGVDPIGRLVGQQVSDQTMEDVVCEIQEIEPAVVPLVERVPCENGMEAIVASVQRGARRPYTYRRRAFLRAGTSNIELSRDGYNRLLLEELHSTDRWENQPASALTFDDLDKAEIVRTVEEAIRRGRMEDPGTRSMPEILRGFGLMRDGSILRAAAALFIRSDRILPDYPQFLLRLARFRGTDKTEFLDNRQYQGNAFDLLLRAERFVREYLPIAGKVVPDLFERTDDPLYPPVALREALANAICHRDYGLGGGSVAIGIYDDRLEITSSGALHFGLTVGDLFKPHDSLPWNPLVAGVFFRRGVIETWGRGTLKMAELSERAGLPRPEIEEIAGSVMVRFRPSHYLAPQPVPHNLTLAQQAILREVGRSQSLALREMKERLGDLASLRGIREDLAFLRQLGLVDSSGHGRGARWRLKS